MWLGVDDDDVGADDLYLSREEDEGQSSTKTNHHYLAERNLFHLKSTLFQNCKGKNGAQNLDNCTQKSL